MLTLTLTLTIAVAIFAFTRAYRAYRIANGFRNAAEQALHEAQIALDYLDSTAEPTDPLKLIEEVAADHAYNYVGWGWHIYDPADLAATETPKTPGAASA